MHMIHTSRAAARPLTCIGALSRPTASPVSPTRKAPSTPSPHVCFSSTSSQQEAKNRVYSFVRNEDQFRTYVALSSSSRKPLLTLWTTSWCSTCHQLSPLLKQLIESGVGEAEGGVGYCEVEYDAPDVMSAGLGLSYMITSVPTLLSFDAGEAQVETKVADGNKLKDKNFLEEWIRTEARRHGGRGGGGGSGGSIFGGLFGSFKS
ncbi:Thioredoxin M-type, chloroplastic [Cytospora mali]|uniref:Thioredoxin M-type, chloroplastic n=1 Tax=Cytospora mali TaxID=578113 RepID=A0A194WAC7_CYTMA|nr:Thioredoxin M-type, chloroplastic [Valsa mali]